MNRYMRILIAVSILIILAMSAQAETITVLKPGIANFPEDARLYTATATQDTWYLCEVYSSTHYAYSMKTGVLTTRPSVVFFETSENAASYRAAMALVSDKESAYAVNLTFSREDDEDDFVEAGLYKLDFGGGEDVLIAELDLSDAIASDAGYEYSSMCKDAIFRDGWLCLLFDEEVMGFGYIESETPQFLLCFNIDTGAKRRYDLVGFTQLIDLRDNALLCCKLSSESTDSLAVGLSLEDGSETPYFAIPGSSTEYARNIAYDAAGDSFFYTLQNRVYAIKSAKAEPKMIASLPIPYPQDGFVFSEGYAVHNTETAAVVPIDWNYTLETRKLVVRGGHSLLDDFVIEHPEIEVEELYDMTSDEIVSAVLTQSPRPDLFVLNTDSDPIYVSLKERGYLLPIESASVQEAVGRMHPDLRNAVSIDGEICALPTSIIIQYSLGVNMPLWEKLQLGDVPETWAEMAAFLNRWPSLAQGWADAPPIAGEEDIGLRSIILHEILLRYDLYRMSAEREPGYDTELFRGLMSIYESIDFEALEAYQRTADASKPLFIYNYAPSVGIPMEREYEGMPLSFSDEIPFFLPVTMGILAVNPYTQNSDIVLQFLEYATESMDAVSRVEMMPEENEPLRYDSYESDILRLENNIDELEQRLSIAANMEDQTMLQTELDQAREQLTRYIDDAWLVKAENISNYRALSDRIGILYPTGVTSNTDNRTWAVYEKYLLGNIGLESFISELDRVLTMSALEGGN